MFTQYALDWQVGFSKSADAPPDRFVPATVPGAVQLDWKRATDMPDYNWGDNAEQYSWMEDVWWLYRTQLPQAPAGQKLYFVARGIDYRFEIRTGTTVLHRQEGMFTPVDLDVTQYAGTTLEVLIHPSPKSQKEPANRDQANESCKPAVSYGWDFHPRLIPLGIWDDCHVETRPAGHIRDAEVRYQLADDLKSVDVWLEIDATPQCTGQVRWTLISRSGGEMHTCTAKSFPQSQSQSLRLSVANPDLWWPNGQGEQALYRSTVELLDAQGHVVQRTESKVGFRRVRLVMNEDAWKEPSKFPKTRSNPPITLEVNGRRIFAKGSNFVGPDIFPGTLDEQRYRELLSLARGAHMNILRCWGGSNIQKEPFFRIADELGIMIWQEFPLSCNNYPDKPAYLAILDQESKSIIRRLRRHASVVLWCGGNELFNSWSGMTDQSLALRLLNRNCYDLDPSRPFLPTSPVMGMGHGTYAFRDWSTGKECFQLYRESSHSAYTEFGVGATTHAPTIRSLIPESDVAHMLDGAGAKTKRMEKMAWRARMHDYSGDVTELDQIVTWSQFLQGEGLKCIFEEVRRQWPRASMAINWCYNEPWPAIANGSIIAWPTKPKPAYEQVKQALRPALPSARIEKFIWHANEIFRPELWLLNDSPAELPAGTITAWLQIGDSRQLLLRWEHGPVPANRNLVGPVIQFALPAIDGVDRMVLELSADLDAALTSRYTLLYRLKK